MPKLIGGVTVVAFVIGILGVAAAAEQMQEVTVQATRVTKTSAGRTASGIPIVDTSLSYGVSYADLNLASHADVLTLKGRVKDASQKACQQLVQLDPLAESSPSEADCTKAAADKALAKVDELAAAFAHK